MAIKKNKIVFMVLAAIAFCYGLLILYAYLPSGPVVPARQLAGKDSGFVTVNGTALHYIHRGETGTPVILIHGFGGSTYTWRSLLPLLAQHHRVYALDLPGFGLSDKPPRADYSLAGQADIVLDFLDELRIPAAILIGHSMGGVVASYSAVKSSSRITKLVLVEPGFYHGKAPAFLEYLFFPLQKIVAKSFYTREGRLRSLAGSFHNKSLVTEELLTAYLQAGSTPGAVDALEHMMITAGAESYEGLSAQITTPALLVWSRHNSNNPLADGQRLEREIRGARLMVIDQSGHYIQEEQPQALADAIHAFID